jgi:anaerobic C4-dicarboxylate transporter
LVALSIVFISYQFSKISDHLINTFSFTYTNKDPEMMREAQKMMNDPAFQERMKQITERPEFKESMSKTQEMMKDESKVSFLVGVCACLLQL